MCDGMTEHWQKLEGTHRAEDQTLLKKKEEKKKEREREDVMGFPAMNYNAIIFKQNKQEPGKTNVGCQPAQLDVLLAQRFFS